MIFAGEILINALSLAGIYLLVALGITLIFGLTRIVFFAQGELVTLGAFLSLTLVELHIPIAFALLASAVIVGIFAETLDLTIFRPTLTRPFNGFVVSLGLIVALEAAYAIRWSGVFYSVPPIFDGTWHIGEIIANKERVALVVIAGSVAGALFLVLERTHYGRGIRALAEDRLSAEVLGVRVGRLLTVVFFVGSALAALGGGLLGTIFPFTAFFGGVFLLKAFAVAIVGGLGNIRGAAVAALTLALVETLAGAYISLEWSYAILLGAMVVIIIVRPQGLFASAGHDAVDPLAGVQFSEIGSGRRLVAVDSTLGRRLALGPRLGVLLIFALGAAAPFLLPTTRSVTLGAFALVNAIGVYSMWFAFRHAGIFSIAQAAFVGVGAYTTALVTLDWGLNFWLVLLMAVVGGIVASAAFGWVAFRASGSYQLIILFSLTELQVQVLQNLISVTGGANGIVLATPADPLFGLVDFSLQNPSNLYYLAFVLACAVIGVLWWLGTTRFGVLLASLRDNEPLAQSLGLNTFRYKVAALMVSGGCAGLGGVLYIYTSVAVSPDYFNSSASIQMALMMLLGGVGTVMGPMIGSLIATFLPEFLNIGPYQSQLLYGILLIVIILVLPSGVVGTLRQQYLKYAERLAVKQRFWRCRVGDGKSSAR